MLHETDPKDGHFDELKRLLFADEQKTLERLDRDVNTLSDRYGTPDKFEHAMAKSLATALKQADVEDHRRLAGAIAPLVVAGIRNEIAQSRDLMVEALYPITGRLVTTAVAKAFQRLVADINARLESAMSLGRWRLRLKALLTGRSYGELVLAEATAFRPQQMLLLDHQSGTLIGAWPSVAEGAEGGENLDLVGGMLSAILGFAEEALHAKSGGLRSLDLGGAKALISASPRFVLATIGQGSTAPQIEDAIDQAFLPFLEDLGGGDAGPLERNDADRSLEELHDAILDELSQIETSRQPKIAYFVLGALALAFAGVVGYQVWQSRIEAAFDAKLAVIEASPELAGYPLIANRDWDANVVHLRGLVPNGPARDVIIERTRAISGDAKVEAELVVVDTARISDTARQVAGVDARLSVLQERVAAAPVVDPKDIAVRLEELRQGASETARRAAGVDARLSALQERVAAAPVVDPDDIALRFDEVQQGASETAKGQAEALARIAALEARLARALAEVEGRLATPVGRLHAEILTKAIFFADGIVYRDKAIAATDLAAIAKALKAAPGVRLRVVGHADGTGSREASIAASDNRAAQVVEDLVALGVPAGQLIAIGRPDSPEISALTGPTSANRRVDFELAFEGE